MPIALPANIVLITYVQIRMIAVVNLGKVVPLVGGVIGGTVDGIGTNIIGKTAKKAFILS